MPAPWRLIFKQKPFIKVLCVVTLSLMPLSRHVQCVVQVHECQLLMMDTGESQSDAGDLWIMGLPFFRPLVQ